MPVKLTKYSACLWITLLLWALTQDLANGASPPYRWNNVAINGGGFVTGIITHPAAAGLMYARTDVGGAYRRDRDTDHWVPITDWVSQREGNLIGCESIAIDPADANRVYLALGTYTNSWAGNGAIARSQDQGRSFEKTDVPFKMGGNDPGRGVGERLVVDPNDGRILMFGSRAAGLWKSSDRAKTWQPINGFPAVATSAASLEPGHTEWADGISFVKFDKATGRPGHPTPVIYAGVCTNQICLFRSTNAGVSWEPIPGQPVGLRPNHMAMSASGVFYISYGDVAAPGDMHDGAVWSLDPKTDIWTDITPVKPARFDKFGYGAVTADAQHPGTLMACSISRWSVGDTVFRSTDAGRHWSSQIVGGSKRDKSLLDASKAPWGGSLSPHWLADIELDPFDSDHAIFVTGFGLWSTHDASALDAHKPIHWEFDNQGLEEMVPLELVSPPAGPHLISVIGDFDGFTHENLDISPIHGRHQPSMGSTRGLDFAALKPEFIVRAGNKGFYSQDGGSSWTQFASTPPNSRGNGPIAVSSDGSTLLWAMSRDSLFRSSDTGSTWTQCDGISQPGQPIADKVNPHRFYVVDRDTHHVMQSLDSGITFSPAAWVVPGKPGQIRAVPGFEGHLWICANDQLFQSTDGGQSAQKVRSVTSATKIGFGKAAPGQSYPAIYIVGEVAGVAGVFRSDDAGNSWLRINDDSHQFGWLNVIIGDPRIYGRVYVGTTGRGIVYGDLAK